MPTEFHNWLLVFLRASGLMAVFPIFTARNFPVQLRLALAAALALFIAPTLPVQATPAAWWPVVWGMLREVLFGLLLGFAGRMIFFALDVAGALISSEIGLTMPAGMNPFGEQATTGSLVLYYLAAVLFLTLDLHHWLLVSFQRSYAVLPIGSVTISQTLALELLRRTALTFDVAVRMAAPFIAVSFILTLIFSVLGRAVPQMNVFSESFAIRIIVGLIMLGSSMQLLAQHIVAYLRRLPEDVLRIAQLLGTG